MNNESKPSVTLKKKNIQQLIDYCLETKLEFTVLPKNGVEEWTLEILPVTITKAVALGMFLRENKMELNGYVPPVIQKVQPKGPEKTEKVETKEKQVLDLTDEPALLFEAN
jgi:hypothetical protein